MYKVDTDGVVALKPAKPAETTAGWFSPGDPEAPTQPTMLPYHWLNTVQQELLALVQAWGGVADRDNDEQLAALFGTAPTLVRMLRYDLHRLAQLALGNGVPTIHVAGALGAAQDWADDYTVSAGSGDDVWVLDWNDLPNGSWVIAGDGSKRLRAAAERFGAGVSITTGDPTGTYVVFISTFENGTLAGSESVPWRLNIALVADYLANHVMKPWILQFDYNQGTGVISNQVVQDMGRSWRPTWDKVPFRTLKDSAGNVFALSVDNASSKPVVRLRAYAAAAAVDPDDVTATILKVTRPDANTRRLELPGPQGEGVDLVGGEAVELLPGGSGDLHQRHETGLVTWRKHSSGVAKGFLSIAGGGQDSADADGHKAAWYGGDYRLQGSKTYSFAVPLEGVYLAASSWAMDLVVAGFLSTATEVDACWLPLPARIGQTLVGFKVRAFLASPTSGDKLTVKIQKIDATAAGGTSAYQTLTGGGGPTAVEWTHSDTSPTQRDVTLATPATLAAGQRYRLELASSITPGTVVHVTEVLAVYRFSEI